MDCDMNTLMNKLMNSLLTWMTGWLKTHHRNEGILGSASQPIAMYSPWAETLSPDFTLSPSTISWGAVLNPRWTSPRGFQSWELLKIICAWAHAKSSDLVCWVLTPYISLFVLASCSGVQCVSKMRRGKEYLCCRGRKVSCRMVVLDSFLK